MLKLTQKRKLGAYTVIALIAVLVSGVVIAGRANYQEYGYYDAQGYYTGSITYPCYGRPIIDGSPTGTPVLELEFSCNY